MNFPLSANIATAAPPSAIPPGFKPRKFGDGFVAANGPLYTRMFEGKLQVGFLVEERHCNPMGICHGGMLAMLGDMVCPITAHATCEAAKNRFLPTIGLQIDYLASAPLGAWVHGQAEVLRATRTMVFVQGLLYADNTLIARVSGVFKIGKPFQPALTPAMSPATTPSKPA
jgi:uncharacterized protein (TIGR00369 family)